MGLLASLAALVHPRDLQPAADALARFDLGGKLFDRVDRLSGGERQRVGLARALLSSARLWLVDEPLSSLDPSRARQALATLVDVARKRGATVVATLHQVDAALACFPRIVGLREGQVAFDLPSAQVTPDLLSTLYARHEGESRHGLTGAWERAALEAGFDIDATGSAAATADADADRREDVNPPSVLMQCR
jgi:phosphonate transport system ATP-binding protein